MELGKNSENRQFHIAITPGDAGGYAILPGDPARVQEIAERLEHPAFVAENREYRTYAGTLGGERVLVTSTGIGGPSAAIAIEELVKCGVHTFIRVGTCGGMQSRVQAGDVIIATAAARCEGTSGDYLPDGYPAVSDFAVADALRRAAHDAGHRHHLGVVHSKDAFYGQTEPGRFPTRRKLSDRWESLIRAGCLASEMEAAALFSAGQALGVRVGVVLTAIWNQEAGGSGDRGEYRSNERAITCAVGALLRLIGCEG